MVATLKYDDHGLRKVRHPLAFSIRETTFEWSETQRLVKDFEARYGARIVNHPSGTYLYAFHDDPGHALAVCEYVDFAESKERDILGSFCESSRLGKLALYALLNDVVGKTPLGWKAVGFVAWSHESMRRMIERGGFKPQLVMYTKEAV
jgi:hypothetical protein